MKKCDNKIPERLNKVGGQAVLEGVMMKAGSRVVTSCRKESGEVVVSDSTFVSVRKKHKLLNIPLLRGVINFVEMMILSVRTLSKSAEALGFEDEETRFEKWLKAHLGVNLLNIIMVLGTVLGLALAVGLFIVLPSAAADFTDYLLPIELGLWRSVVEGVVRIIIFLVYLWLVSLMPDIKRTFMYHGAEHKSIACFESGAPLTPAEARKFTRFHPRCGTSFMFFMILIGVFAGMLIRVIAPELPTPLYVAVKILILPLVMGIGYEIIMLAGKHDNFLTRALSAPGIWVQRLTTKEPTEDMLEVAIISIKCALRDDFPEFKEFYESRGWEAKTDECAEGVADAENPDSGDTPECAEPHDDGGDTEITE